jgi:hypothetical protein
MESGLLCKIEARGYRSVRDFSMENTDGDLLLRTLLPVES